MKVSEINNPTRPFPKYVLPCSLFAFALVAISEVLGVGNSLLIWTYILERPDSATFAMLVGILVVFVFPAIHIGIFSLFKSRKNPVTFARILKGWSIAILCYYILGIPAGLYKDYMQLQYADQLTPAEGISEERWAKMKYCTSITQLAESAFEAKSQGLSYQQFLNQQLSVQSVTDHMRIEIEAAYQQPGNTDLTDYRAKVYRSCYVAS
jgi:hypothetical protein